MCRRRPVPCLAGLLALLAITISAHPSSAVEHHRSRVIVKIWEDVGWIVPRGTRYLLRNDVTGIGLLAIVDGGTAARKASVLRSQGLFEFVELDHQISANFDGGMNKRSHGGDQSSTCHRVPNDEMWLYQWGASAIMADRAWCHTSGEGIVVAVIDTGIDVNHPDLKANLWVNEAEAFGEEGIDDDGNGFVDDVHGYDFVNEKGNMFDDFGHGTHVSGIIGGARNNQAGISGIAPAVKIMSLKFMDETGVGYLSRAVFAVLYAVAHNVDVISSSWGSQVQSQALEVAFNTTLQGGQLLTCSAGNTGSDLDFSRVFNYPASFRMPNMISVLAADQLFQRSGFSNYGVFSVDVAAPGADILSSIPMYKGGYQTESGTSQAVPHVSGVAALVAAMGWANGNLTRNMPPLQRSLWIKQVIMLSITYDPSLAPFVRTAGMVNAYKAVKFAQHGVLPKY